MLPGSILSLLELLEHNGASTDVLSHSFYKSFIASTRITLAITIIVMEVTRSEIPISLHAALGEMKAHNI